MRDPVLVPTAIVDAVGLGESGGLPALENLAASMRDKQLPLILENGEQVAASAPTFRCC